MNQRNPPPIESSPISLLTIGIFLLIGLFGLGIAVAQDDEPPEYLPGLIGKYIDDKNRSISRVDSSLLFQWSGDRPDVRLTAGSGFHVEWSGFLFVNSSGKHRIGVHATGEFQVQVLDRTVIVGESREAKWQFSEEVDLPFGRHPITVSYKTNQPRGRLGLYWSGPRFQLEPISEKHLVHRFEDTIDSRFEDGEWLHRGLRCVACHVGAPDEKPLPGPALTHLRGNIRADWIVDMLQTGEADPLKNEPNVPKLFGSQGRRMPHFQLTTEEALAVVAALFHHSAESIDPIEERTDRPNKNVPFKKLKKGDWRVMSKPPASWRTILCDCLMVETYPRLAKSVRRSSFADGCKTLVSSTRTTVCPRPI
jgi:hypothetical protein